MSTRTIIGRGTLADGNVIMMTEWSIEHPDDDFVEGGFLVTLQTPEDVADSDGEDPQQYADRRSPSFYSGSLHDCAVHMEAWDYALRAAGIFALGLV